MVCRPAQADIDAEAAAVFDELDPGRKDDPSQKTRLERHLSIDQKEVAEFLLKRMNTLPGPEPSQLPDTAIACMLAADPRKHTRWLIDNYARLTPLGRGRMVQSLRLLDNAEAYELVASFLDDHETVKNPRAAKLAPGYYADMRVCDYAFNTIALMIMISRSDKAIWKPGLPKRLGSYSPYPERDKVIAEFSSWWKDEGRVILQKKSRLEKEDSPLAKKIKEFIDRPKRSSTQPSSMPASQPADMRDMRDSHLLLTPGEPGVWGIV